MINITHIICLVHNRDNGFENFKKTIESTPYILKSGSEREIGKKAFPSVAELKFVDVIIKDDYKEEFLSNMKAHTGLANLDVEPLHQSDDMSGEVAHGVDGKGFKIGILRKMIQWAMKMLNCRAIDMSKITAKRNEEMDRLKQENSWKGYCMVIGELPDGVAPSGRENT